MKYKIFILVLFILLCESVGVVGSIFTRSAITEWYVHLQKPFFTPPSWVFGPVWTLLYATMGISLFLIVDKRKSANIKPAITIFIIQLFLNGIWSPAFFGMRSPILGLVVIIPLLIMILATILEFYKTSKAAGLILIPYLLWVAFATVLNFAFVFKIG